MLYTAVKNVCAVSCVCEVDPTTRPRQHACDRGDTPGRINMNFTCGTASDRVNMYQPCHHASTAPVKGVRSCTAVDWYSWL